LAGFGTNTAAIAAGGHLPGGVSAACELWNGSAWTEVNDLNDSRGYLNGCAGISTAGIVFGGDGPGATANTETWNGTSWTEVNNLNTARWSIAGAGTTPSALGIGGYSGPPATYHAITEDWNGVNWVEVADLNTGRAGSGSAGVSDNTTALLFGGNTPPRTAATEEWTIPSFTAKTVDTD
jgi:hypothetical protein